MKSLRYIILFTVFGLNISCEKEVNVDLPNHVVKLSINCNLIGGEVPEAIVSHSIHSVSSRDNFNALPDAEVILFENGIPVDTLLHYDNISDEYWYSFDVGVFKGDYIVQSGKSYKVQANYKNYETAYGETTCPSNFIEISDIDVSGLKIDSTEYYSGEGFDYYRTGKVTFKLTGPLNNELHYFLSVVDENREIDAFELTSQDPLIAIDGNNISEDGTLYPSENLYISGSNGNLNTILTIDINPEGAWGGFEEDLTDGIELRLEAQSDEYYQFMKKVEEYENSQDNPFTEMVFLPNNIKGGYGFVSGGAIQRKVSL